MPFVVVVFKNFLLISLPTLTLIITLVSSNPCFAKRCESINTVVSFIWWIIGFYWVVEEGGDKLLGEAPNLYWSSVIFLAIDVFFAVFCVILACLVGIALCYCLPCIIALLYAVAGTEGVSEVELGVLPMYKFQAFNSNGAGKMVPTPTNGFMLSN